MRGFGAGWRIPDLLFGFHRFYARCTRVCVLLYISSFISFLETRKTRELERKKLRKKDGRGEQRPTGKSTVILQHPPLHRFFDEDEIDIRQSLCNLPEFRSESIESSQDPPPTFGGYTASTWIRGLG